MAVTRARSRAEWNRAATTRMDDLIEIDRNASTIAPEFEDEDRGIIRSVQCGGNMGMQLISTFNNAFEDKCNYCHEGPSNGTHIRWGCKYFEPIRQETDKASADIPSKYLSDPIRCGIAPAMSIGGELAFWGAEVGMQETPETKKILGINLDLSRGAENGDETRKKERSQQDH